jgi:prepilin-type N-terminal cleavage/methylation domain-containing protein
MNPKRGLTLLEVIVALVLMGGVVVSTLLAFSKHRGQLALATERIEATRRADTLLQQLRGRRGGIPVQGLGEVPGTPEWVWQTRPVGGTVLADVPLRLIRFEIRRRGVAQPPLVRVDFVKAASP